MLLNLCIYATFIEQLILKTGCIYLNHQTISDVSGYLKPEDAAINIKRDMKKSFNKEPAMSYTANLKDNLQEIGSSDKFPAEVVDSYENDITLQDIKSLLKIMLHKIDNISHNAKRCDIHSTPTIYSRIDIPSNKIASSNRYNSQNLLSEKRKRQHKIKKRQKWGEWTVWSACSVTCGKGREIRWRHCLEDCDFAETEMDEKTCQLPACKPAKLFGVIPL